MKFKTKILFIFTSFTILVTALIAWISYSTSRELYFNEVKIRLTIAIDLINSEVRSEYLPLLDQSPKTQRYTSNILDRYRTKLSLETIFIFNDRFQILVKSGGSISKERLQLSITEIQDLEDGNTAHSTLFRGEDKNWYIWSFYRINSAYYLGLQEAITQLNHLNHLPWLFALIVLSGIVISIAAAWFLARTVSKPVEQMVWFSEQIGAGNMHSPIPMRINNELEILRQAMLQMRNKIERSGQEKEQMLAQIAHELRNPLGSIELLNGLLLEKKDSSIPSREYLEKIKKEISIMKGQINAFLEFSRPAPANPKALNLKTEVREIAGLFSERMQRMAVELEYFEEEECIIRFDPLHLRQIISNLIDNSLDSFEKTGKISIAVHAGKGGRVIRFNDNGSGISTKLSERIFQPFFTTKESGAGLGLAIVQKLCFENGYYIDLEDSDRPGTTFIIRERT